MSFGVATSSVTQLLKVIVDSKNNLQNVDFICFNLKIDIKIHEIRSSVSVEIFWSKRRRTAGNILINLPEIRISGLFVTTRFIGNIKHIIDAGKNPEILTINSP